jgi:solute carrier family 35 protein
MNVLGIMCNSAGVAWYAYEKYTGGRQSVHTALPPESMGTSVMHREDSQLTFESSQSPRSKMKDTFNSIFIGQNGVKAHNR